MGKYDILFQEDAPTAKKPGKYAILFEDEKAPMHGEEPSQLAPKLLEVGPGSEQKPPITLGRILETLTPYGSYKEIAGQLSGERSSSPLRAGLAAADLASLGLGAKLGTAAKGLNWGARGLATLGKEAIVPFLERAAVNSVPQLAAGAGAGAASLAAEQMGAPAPIQMAAGLAGGIAGGHLGGAKLAPKPAGNPIIQELESLGGKPTAAMRSGGALASAADLSARTNPLIDYLPGGENIKRADETMAEAVRKMAEGRMGVDVNVPRAEQAGEAFKGALDSIATKRAEAYAPALEQLKKAPGFANFQKEIMTAAEPMAGDVSSVSYEAFQKALKQELKGKTSPAQIDKSISGIKSRFKQNLGAGMMGGQETRDFNVMLNSVKDKFYSGLDNLSSSKPGEPGTLGQMLREAKGDYAEATKGMTPLMKALASKSAKPEAIGKAVLGAGSEGVSALLKQADPKTAASLQREMALAILADSIGEGGQVSAKKLASALDVKYRDIVPLLGDEQKNLKDLAEAMRLTKAQTLGSVNSSGSGTSTLKGAQMLLGGAGMYSPTVAAGLGAKTLADAAYAGLGPQIQDAAQFMGRIPIAPAMAVGAGMGRVKTSKLEDAKRRIKRFQGR